MVIPRKISHAVSTSILSRSTLILDLSSQQLYHVTNYSRGLKQELFTIFYASRGAQKSRVILLI